MPSMIDQRSHLRQIDIKILDLLEERALLVANMIEESSDAQLLTEEDIQLWLEDSAERGLDNDIAMEKVYRAIVAASR